MLVSPDDGEWGTVFTEGNVCLKEEQQCLRFFVCQFCVLSLSSYDYVNTVFHFGTTCVHHGNPFYEEFRCLVLVLMLFPELTEQSATKHRH